MKATIDDFLIGFSDEQIVKADEIIKNHFKGLTYFEADMLLKCIGIRLEAKSIIT